MARPCSTSSSAGLPGLVSGSAARIHHQRRGLSHRLANGRQRRPRRSTGHRQRHVHRRRRQRELGAGLEREVKMCDLSASAARPRVAAGQGVRPAICPAPDHLVIGPPAPKRPARRSPPQHREVGFGDLAARRQVEPDLEQLQRFSASPAAAGTSPHARCRARRQPPHIAATKPRRRAPSESE